MIHFWCLFASNNHIMTRQSISLTKPNDNWLKTQVDSKDYSSKSELVNDLIRQARKQQTQIDWIRAKLEKAENSGFTSDAQRPFSFESVDHIKPGYRRCVCGSDSLYYRIHGDMVEIMASIYQKKTHTKAT